MKKQTNSRQRIIHIKSKKIPHIHPHVFRYIYSWCDQEMQMNGSQQQSQWRTCAVSLSRLRTSHVVIYSKMWCDTDANTHSQAEVYDRVIQMSPVTGPHASRSHACPTRWA